MVDKAKIIDFIKKQQASRFRVIDNTGTDKKIIGGQFPDIIFLQTVPPPNNNVLFVFKIQTDDDLVNSISEWKSLSTVPSVLYVVVPKEKLDEAKKLASATGINARFAWYVQTGDEVTQLNYE